jgi:hypothetical protein
LIPVSGILLISDPFLKDPNFMRTVVFLCEHQEQGSFGFVLNRKYEKHNDELIPELEGHKNFLVLRRTSANGYNSFFASISRRNTRRTGSHERNILGRSISIRLLK